MIAFQCRNLSRWFLIGATIMFSILLPLILKTTPSHSKFASFLTNSSNGVSINSSNSCCNLVHGKSDKLKRIRELRNESIANAHSLNAVRQALEQIYLHYIPKTNDMFVEELINNYQEAADDFLRRSRIIFDTIDDVDKEIDAMEREFIECIAGSIRTRPAGLLRCGWRMGRDINGMKNMIGEVFKIIQMSLGNYTIVAKYRSSLRKRDGRDRSYYGTHNDTLMR